MNITTHIQETILTALANKGILDSTDMKKANSELYVHYVALVNNPSAIQAKDLSKLMHFAGVKKIKF